MIQRDPSMIKRDTLIRNVHVLILHQKNCVNDIYHQSKETY